jgi:hypothetical protein
VADVAGLAAPEAPAAPARAEYFARHFRAAMTDGDRRVAAQQHLDARAQRISDYADSLEVALAAAPTSTAAAVLQRRLVQARADLAAASKPRLAAPTPPSAKARSARVAAPADAPMAVTPMAVTPAVATAPAAVAVSVKETA